jgi:prepilin-type N-terminal cleavage/methylation domain-containing protein
MKTYSSSYMQKSTRRKGYSLPEVIIALSIFTLFIGAFTSISTTVSKLLVDGVGKLQINDSIRVFTSEVSRSGRAASEFYIHTAYSNGVSAANSLTDGQSGDFILLAFKEIDLTGNPSTVDASRTYLTKIVGYARVPDASGEGPVYKFELKPPSGVTWAISDYSVHGIVASAITNNSVQLKEVIQLAKGKSDGKLFYRYGNHRFIVNGEIIHGDNPKVDSRVSNTYNFTVSPRG